MRAIGEVEFFDRWRDQYAEWCRIRDAMIADGRTPSAWDVSKEQREQRFLRGQTLVTCGPDGGFFEITPAEDRERANVAAFVRGLDD